MTDVQRIVDYLSRGNTLTALEGMAKLGMTDFRKRVSDARQQCYKILDNWVTTSSGKRIKRYFMKPEE